MFKIKFDARETLRMLKLAPKAIDKAEFRAVSRATTGARTDVSQVLRGEVGLNIKARDLKRYINVSRPRKGQKNPEGLVSVAGKSIPLYKFSPRPSKPGIRVLKSGKRVPSDGVSVQVLKTGGRKTVKGSFVVKAGGHVGIFMRKGKSRLPIRELCTAGPGHYLDHGQGRVEIEKRVAVRLKKEMDRSIEFELKKAEGRV